MLIFSFIPCLACCLIFHFHKNKNYAFLSLKKLCECFSNVPDTFLYALFIPLISLYFFNIASILILYSYLIILPFEVINTSWIHLLSLLEHHFFLCIFIIVFLEYILMKYLRPGLKASFLHKHVYVISRFKSFVDYKTTT